MKLQPTYFNRSLIDHYCKKFAIFYCFEVICENFIIKSILWLIFDDNILHHSLLKCLYNIYIEEETVFIVCFTQRFLGCHQSHWLDRHFQLLFVNNQVCPLREFLTALKTVTHCTKFSKRIITVNITKIH